MLVPQKLPDVAVDLVRARSRDDVEHRAGVPAVLGAEGVGESFHLFERIRRRIIQPGVPECRVEFRAVKKEQILVGTRA